MIDNSINPRRLREGRLPVAMQMGSRNDLPQLFPVQNDILVAGKSQPAPEGEQLLNREISKLVPTARVQPSGYQPSSEWNELGNFRQFIPEPGFGVVRGWTKI